MLLPISLHFSSLPSTLFWLIGGDTIALKQPWQHAFEHHFHVGRITQSILL
jgi:hypothetical protein